MQSLKNGHDIVPSKNTLQPAMISPRWRQPRYTGPTMILAVSRQLGEISREKKVPQRSRCTSNHRLWSARVSRYFPKSCGRNVAVPNRLPAYSLVRARPLFAHWSGTKHATAARKKKLRFSSTSFHVFKEAGSAVAL